ncbi:MAG TPA: hypothetical protein DCE71_03850 [Parachlamydiales bacterium]|nr:hypothetical protein [Parachlamydiales bacterium]
MFGALPQAPPKDFVLWKPIFFGNFSTEKFQGRALFKKLYKSNKCIGFQRTKSFGGVRGGALRGLKD